MPILIVWTSRRHSARRAARAAVSFSSAVSTEPPQTETGRQIAERLSSAALALEFVLSLLSLCARR
jgi:hypothetical protein